MRDLKGICDALAGSGWEYRPRDEESMRCALGELQHAGTGLVVRIDEHAKEEQFAFRVTGWPKSTVTGDIHYPYSPEHWAHNDVCISWNKEPARIARELRSRLLDKVLPVVAECLERLARDDKREIERRRIEAALAEILGGAVHERGGFTRAVRVFERRLANPREGEQYPTSTNIQGEVDYEGRVKLAVDYLTEVQARAVCTHLMEVLLGGAARPVTHRRRSTEGGADARR